MFSVRRVGIELSSLFFSNYYYEELDPWELEDGFISRFIIQRMIRKESSSMFQLNLHPLWSEASNESNILVLTLKDGPNVFVHLLFCSS